MKQPVLVVDLDECHRRIFGVSAPRVGVAVRQQFAGVLFLQFQNLAVEKSDHVPPLERGVARLFDFLRKTVSGIEGAVIQQAQVDIDAIAFEPRDEVVEAVERLWIEVARAGRTAGENPFRKMPHVHDVEADNVDAELRQPICDFLGIRMSRDICAERQIHAEKADSLLSRAEMPVRPGLDRPELPRRFRQPAAEVHYALRRIIPRQNKGEQRAFRRACRGGRNHEHPNTGPSDRYTLHAVLPVARAALSCATKRYLSQLFFTSVIDRSPTPFLPSTVFSSSAKRVAGLSICKATGEVRPDSQK